MNTFQNQMTRRLFAFFAWVIMTCSAVVVITGVLVSTTSITGAEQTDDEITEQHQDEDPDDQTDADDTADPDPQPGQQNEPADQQDEADDGDADPGTEDQADDGDADPGDDPARGPPDEQIEEMLTHFHAEAADDAAGSAAELAGDVTEQARTTSLDAVEDDTPFYVRVISFLGIAVLLFVAWLMSANRSAINWRLVGVGVGLQVAFGVFIFYVPGGQLIFDVATKVFAQVLDFTDEGSEFLFQSQITGQWDPALHNFAFKILPTIIFFSSLMTILYYLGVMQKIVKFFAIIMKKTMDLSGAESTSAAANVFVGQTEAPLVIKPFVKNMTRSELAVLMTGGFATVAGGVLAAYVGMLESTFPDIAGHLIAASVMSAPAAIVVAKIMYPETEEPATRGDVDVQGLKKDVNVLGAASRGAGEGLKLALNVGAMLLAFIALIAMVDYLIQLPSLMYNKNFVLTDLVEYYQQNGMTVPEGCGPAEVIDEEVKGCIMEMQAAASGAAAEGWVAPMIDMRDIFGWIFWPFAFVMGVPVQDCHAIAQLLGEKMVINEFVAYISLNELLMDPDVVLSERSVIIATYALCGFANFGSIGIQLGGIGGIAPSRKQDLAKIALQAMIGGTLAAFMTGTIAGILI